MAKLKTIRVTSKVNNTSIVINENDYDEELHVLGRVALERTVDPDSDDSDDDDPDLDDDDPDQE